VSAEIHILVVDDRDADRAAVQAIAAPAGYRVLEARTGQEALKLLLQVEVAVVIVELALPDTSGFELVELIRRRERYADVPILFATARALEPEIEHQGYRAGAIDYLSKPYVPAIVRAKLDVLAHLYRQRKELERRADREHELGLAELRLASERRYRSLADAVPNIVWTALPDGRIDYFNRRWFEYTGISIERAEGTWEGAVHPDDLAACHARWRHALETGEMLQTECRLRRSDGAYRWQLCRAVPEYGASAQIVAWLGSFTNIDDELRGRAALVEFKATLDAVLDAVLIFDPHDWHLLYVNQGASALLGYPEDELLRLRPPDFTAEHDEAGFRELVAPIIAGAKPGTTIETAFRRRDARTVPVEVSLQLIRSDGGRIVSIARDITDRTRDRLERERLYREAVDAIRARDEFISIASHELRTPLSALQLQIEMLLTPPRRDPSALPSPEHLGKKLQLAARQVDRLSRLIAELLDVSRITGRRLKLDREALDLAALARDLVERLAPDAAKANCALELDAREPVPGVWDRMRLEQVVTNLLSNAFKFGAGKPVRISVERDGAIARLSVADRGIGIATADAERIFHRFEQAVSTRVYGGLGLGLYIVRGLVEAHRGTVHVDSRPNVGSTFTIELPREPPPEETHAPDEHDRAGARAGEPQAHLGR
jgi:PAS domain S-box-containing protein